MSIQAKLYGVNPAVATPLTSERDIDVPAYKKLIRRMVDAGCSGIMILGTAGEGFALDAKNYALAIQTAVEEINGEYPVLVCAGGFPMETVLKNMAAAYNLGADAILAVPPFYYPLPQNAVADFYRELADKSKLPVLIYNIPALTKNAVEAETVIQLSQEENIVGLKDSSGDLAYMQKVVAYTDKDKFRVFQGRAPFFLASLLFGAAGTQGPIPNIAPELELGLHQAIKEGNMELAKSIQLKIMEIAKIFSYNGNPISTNLKGLMAALDICEKYTAPTIPVLSDDKVKELGQKLASIVVSKNNETGQL
ncbi:MAG: dihydrodipicolinate synthase family protein [Syntrophomonadaceae bacterium]|nr:dihydrodipicolinate synthase family protein [Syntrophomonadaceae bacterium]